MAAPRGTSARHDESHPHSPIRHRWRVFWAVWAAGTLLSLLWAIATPLGASPDEPAHIIKAAAVAHGEFTGTPSEGTTVVQVPQYIAWTHAQTCYAFADDESAACSPAVPEPTGAIVESTTTAGLYNPVYYLVVGWPSLVFDNSVGVYVMRAVSGALSTLFLALTALMMCSWRRPALPLAGLGVLMTPMMLFLSASVNPNAVETTGTVAVLVAMISILLNDRRDLLAERSAILVASALFAANARGLSPLWLAVVVLAPLLLVGWDGLRELLRTRAVIVAIVGVAIVTAFAGVWLLATNSLGRAISDPDGIIYPGAGSPPISGFIWALESTPEFVLHMIGLFGWMDTAAPFGVAAVWVTAMLTLVIGAVTVLRGKTLKVFLVLLAAAILLPPIVQGLYVNSGGYIWQGRYNLPLVLATLAAATAFLSPYLPVRHPIVRRVWGCAVILMAAAHLYVFAWVLRRYAVGLDGSWQQTFRTPEWSAPGGNITIVAIMALTLAALAWWAWRAVLRVDSETRPAAVKKRASELL